MKPKILARSEKILLFLYEFGNGTRAKIRYEDIVAGLFKKYPKDFHLKGYDEYPDSGDLIHKPLYDFKKKGLVNAENKVFSLTDRGIEFAKQLAGSKFQTDTGKDRLSRSTETEVARVKSSEGFLLFADGKENELSDGDLYSYLGVTVRTSKNAFIGRLKTMSSVAEELKRQKSVPMYVALVRYHEFLIGRYASVIEYFTKN